MIVSGLRRAPSAMRRRSWPTAHRPPPPARLAAGGPARLGASVPWKRSSGIGPLWHNRQRPTLRLATIARPRAASPGRTASGSGMASPSTTTTSPGACCAHAGGTGKAGSTASRPARTIASAEGLGGDGLEPALGVERLLGAEAADDLERADAAGARNVGQHALVGT